MQNQSLEQMSQVVFNYLVEPDRVTLMKLSLNLSYLKQVLTTFTKNQVAMPSNLFPRTLSHHNHYQKQGKVYWKQRKAVLPRKPHIHVTEVIRLFGDSPCFSNSHASAVNADPGYSRTHSFPSLSQLSIYYVLFHFIFFLLCGIAREYAAKQKINFVIFL